MKVTWSDGLNSSTSDDKMHVVKCVSWKLKAIMTYFLRMMNLTYNELHDVFETLYDEYKKFSSKYSLLKKKHFFYNELHDAFKTLYDEYKKFGSKYSLLKITMHVYLLRKIL
jgi:hypothetical protein